VLESPAATFHRIAISEQKNYVYLLFALCGPMVFAFVLSALHVGNYPVNFGLVLLSIAFLGPLVGIIVFPAFSAIIWLACRFGLARDHKYRRIQALLAYSFSPLAMYSAIVLPIACAVFGSTLFSNNPSAAEYKPLVFWVLGLLLTVATIWIMVNITTALKVVRVQRWKSAILALLAGGAIGFVIYEITCLISNPIPSFIKTL
jgi:hypothetical protein